MDYRRAAPYAQAGGRLLRTDRLVPHRAAPAIDDAQVDDSVLGACLKTTARKMVFPAFQGEAFQVRIPMVLGGGR